MSKVPNEECSIQGTCARGCEERCEYENERPSKVSFEQITNLSRQFVRRRGVNQIFIQLYMERSSIVRIDLVNDRLQRRETGEQFLREREKSGSNVAKL